MSKLNWKLLTKKRGSSQITQHRRITMHPYTQTTGIRQAYTCPGERVAHRKRRIQQPNPGTADRGA